MNGQDNEYIKKSVKFSYTNKENATDILDDLCVMSEKDKAYIYTA
jgi:hypothetical protein